MKKLKAILCSLLSATMLFGTLSAGMVVSAEDMEEDYGVYEDDGGEVYIPEATGYTVKKISNPDRKQGEVDGLMEGGDRENSYTWRMAQRGDYIYIATTRNIASALVNMYGSAFAQGGISLDEFWTMIDTVTNGDIPRNDANEGANIISYNRTTGAFEVIYTAEAGDYFRMAVTFGDNVYFGSYSAVPTNPQYILKLDTDGSFTKVYETTGSVSLRANCVYDDHLFFAGADDREVVAEGDDNPTKMAVLRKSNEDDTVWERVADYKDFGAVAYDPIMASWAGAPIWELASHEDYIYATAPSTNGFVMFRGHPAAEGETANAYGWYWEEVVGLNNGINNPGLSEQEGGEPGTMRSLIGSVYEYNGELYAYNFDHAFGGEASAFAGAIQQMAGADVKPSDYLAYLYDSLHNPQKIWKLDDETGKFEECEEFTKLMKNTTNEYVWRLGEYDGDLYVATMDASVFYGYLTQLTDGSFIKMTAQERKEKLGYVTQLLKIVGKKFISAKVSALKTKLEAMKQLLENFDPSAMFSEQKAEQLLQYRTLASDLQERYANAKDDLNTALSNAAADYVVGDNTNTEAGQAIAGLFPSGVLDALRQKFKSVIGTIGSGSLKETIASYTHSMIDRLVGRLTDKVFAAMDKIDWKGVEMYAYISKAVRHSEPGFDLYRSDGYFFESITRTGFDDKYNYGCSAFLSTEEGLYIGTCNPFYGGQLYLLRNDPSDASYFDNDFLVIGEEAVLHLATKNGTTDYTYTVQYKKTMSESWVTVAEDTTASSVTFQPKTATLYDVKVIAKGADGSQFEGYHFLNVNKKLTNTSVLMADTIKLGEKVKVRTRATGGGEDHQFAVYYKKASSERWIRVRDYSYDPASNIVPKTAATYDIKVNARDDRGTVVTKTFQLTVTK